jgi:DNA polymerase I
MQIIDTIEKLKTSEQEILNSEYIVFDLETSGLKFTDDIFSIQIKTNKDEYYLPFDHLLNWKTNYKKPEKTTVKKKSKKQKKIIQETLFNLDDYVVIPKDLVKDDDLPLNDNYKPKIIEKETEKIIHQYLKLKDCKNILSEIFESDIPKIAHNMKFDAKLLIYNNINFKNWYFDTMLAAWTLKEDRLSYSLKNLYAIETGDITTTFSDLTKNTPYYLLTIDEQIQYAMDDVRYTEFLYFKWKDEIFKDYKLFFEKQMMSVCEVLTYMELQGVYVDEEYGLKFTEEKMEQINLIEKELYNLIGKHGFDSSFNFNSNPQLSQLFYNTLGYKYKKNKSVDKFALNFWAGQKSEIAKNLLEYRQLNDTVKFIHPEKEGSILFNINKITGRVHTSFNQHRTVMHRLSSSDPNLQNLPRQGDVRQIVIAPENKQLLIADYSQIELRSFAHYSKDPKFLEAYSSDNPIDIHEQTRKNIIEPLFPTASKVEQRSKAKNVNFGVWYGISNKGLSNLLDIPEDKAQRILHDVFNYYHVNFEWINKVKRWTTKNKWVGNIYGGKRRFYNFDFQNSSRSKIHFIHKEAVHFIISSTAACILKAKMMDLFNKLQLHKRSDIKMILQIHDELIFEIDENFDPQEVISIMESPEPKFSIPLLVEYEKKQKWQK